MHKFKVGNIIKLREDHEEEKVTDIAKIIKTYPGFYDWYVIKITEYARDRGFSSEENKVMYNVVKNDEIFYERIDTKLGLLLYG